MKIEMSKLVFDESIEALALRVRWYDVRRCKVPESLLLAFNYYCSVAGFDPKTKRLASLSKR